MTTDTLPIKQERPFAISPIEFEATKDELRALVATSAELTVAGVEDTEGIAIARAARLKLKDLRVGIDKRRKSLKADSLEYGRKVDSVAKELTAIIEPEEKRLQHEEDVVKREQERLAREAEERYRAKIRDRLQALQLCGKSYIESEVAELSDADFGELLASERADKERRDREAAEAEAERQRVEEANRVEAERLAKEKAELDRQQAEAVARLKRMQARLELLSQSGFAHSMTGDQLADMDADLWEQLLDQARHQKAERDRAAAEQQAKLDRQRQEQEEREEQIKAEKRRVFVERCDELRKYAVPTDRTKPGQIVVNYETTAEQFAETLATAKLLHQEWQADVAEQARREERERIERDAAEAKAKAAAAERERQRLEALKPDREKLLAVADAVAAINVPDVCTAADDAAWEIAEALEDCAIKIRQAANKLVNA